MAAATPRQRLRPYNSGPNGNKDLGQACSDGDVCTRGLLCDGVCAQQCDGPGATCATGTCTRSTIRRTARSSATSASSAAVAAAIPADFRLGAPPGATAGTIFRRSAGRHAADARWRASAARVHDVAVAQNGRALAVTPTATARARRRARLARSWRRCCGSTWICRRSTRSPTATSGSPTHARPASGASCARRRRTRTSSRCSSPPTAPGR